MRFASTHWLWLIPLALLLTGALIYEVKARSRKIQKFASHALLAMIAPGLDYKRPIRKVLVWSLALCLVALAIARPQGKAKEETSMTTGMDFFVVLDLSNSMETEDVSPSRLRLAKRWLTEFLQKARGERVGLVVFAGSSHLAAPLTTDLDYIQEVLEIQSPHLVQTQGTDIGRALEVARQAIERGAEEVGPKDQAQSSRAVILISDGEDHEEGAVAQAAELKKLGVRLYTVGVGSASGGPIPQRDESGTLRGYKRDRSGEAIVSRFNPKALQELTSNAGGRYWDMTAEASELAQLLEDASGLKRGEFAERKVKIYSEFFQWPLSIALLLLMIEVSVWVRGRASRQVTRNAAVWFAVAVMPLFTNQVQASPVDPYFLTREGEKALQAGENDLAKQKFSDARSADPNRPDLIYNEGTVQALTGDDENASKKLQDAVESARKQGLTGLEAKSLFNLGVSREKAKDTPGALKSYVEAIEAASKAKDADLEAKARKNLQLLYLNQKNQSQQNQNQKNDPKQQKQDQSKQDQQKQEQQKQDQKKDQPGQQDSYEQRQPKKYESQKLSKGDADRVLSEISGKDKELQAKLRGQKSKGNPQGGKDW